MNNFNYIIREKGRRKKRQVGRALMVLMLCILLGTSVLLSTGGAAGTPQYIEVVVQPGDTLWNIARNHLPPGMDIRKYVFLIEKANGISNSLIYPGEVLKLPV